MKEEPKGLNGSSCGGCWAKGPNGWTGEDRRCAEELRWGKGCAPLGPPIPLAPKSWPSPSTLVPALVCSSQSGPPSPKYVFRLRGHLASDEMKTAKRFLEQVPPRGSQGPRGPRSHTRGVCLGPWVGPMLRLAGQPGSQADYLQRNQLFGATNTSGSRASLSFLAFAAATSASFTNASAKVSGSSS